MSPDNSQKKIDRLARVRENQRKSRAKKQEHIHDLEQKLASFQDHIRRQDVEHRLVVQKLEAENTKLRHLLACSGLAQSEIDGYLRAGSDPATAEKIAIPPMQRAEIRSSLKHKNPVVTTDAGEPSRRQPSPTNARPRLLEPPIFDGRSEVSMLPNPNDLAGTIGTPLNQNQTMCGCAPAEDEKSWPTNEDILNTTLCAIGEELINQYNTRGVDMAEIRRKLRSGFSKGLTTDEGCRVQNQILFQVLDEISNN